jgi:branched-chain amino acid transport system substrate-binding protein
VIAAPRLLRRLAPLVALLLLSTLAACSSAASAARIVMIATILPTSGPNATVGLAMQRAVDLAARQNTALGGGYTLAVTHADEGSGFVGPEIATLAGESQVLGVIGPLSSDSALTMLPTLSREGLATISPSATLPGLTQAAAASAEGLAFAQLHPPGRPVAFFRLPETDNAAGRVAADLALAPVAARGLGAQSVFVVDDGSLAGKTLATAFTQELTARHGSLAGQKSLVSVPQDNVQAIVSAIVAAEPDLVFFAGNGASAAELRGTLSLSGAPQVPLLTVGSMAGDPTWSDFAGVPAAAANTTALLPAPALSTLPGAKAFVAAFQQAYPDQPVLPESALAYDAAMDEIAAIKGLIQAGKPVTRQAVLAAVATAHYAGVTGTVAFDQNGDNTTPLGYSLYTCDSKGAWQFVTALKG